MTWTSSLPSWPEVCGLAQLDEVPPGLPFTQWLGQGLRGRFRVIPGPPLLAFSGCLSLVFDDAYFWRETASSHDWLAAYSGV